MPLNAHVEESTSTECCKGKIHGIGIHFLTVACFNFESKIPSDPYVWFWNVRCTRCSLICQSYFIPLIGEHMYRHNLDIFVGILLIIEDHCRSHNKTAMLPWMQLFFRFVDCIHSNVNIPFVWFSVGKKQGIPHSPSKAIFNQQHQHHRRLDSLR